MSAPFSGVRDIDWETELQEGRKVLEPFNFTCHSPPLQRREAIGLCPSSVPTAAAVGSCLMSVSLLAWPCWIWCKTSS